MIKDIILVIGASGQIGTELVMSLRSIHGANSVVASDLKPACPEIMDSGPFELLDIMHKSKLTDVIQKYKVSHVYLLAALLSATAEKNIELGWDLNMRSLFHVLDLARFGKIKKVFWPSSIAVFGPSSQMQLTPQYTIMEPNTVYGISKLAGERWCEYYHNKFKIDVRSIRYPGLVGHKAEPGGGTTDYAVHVFHQALQKGKYLCFLSEKTALPMMYMPDAIRATLELMEAPSEKIKIRSSYNVSGTSFRPEEIALQIQKHLPQFKINYLPDERQSIADSWPDSIDDIFAREHWGWKHKYNLKSMSEDMIMNLKKKYQ